MKYLKQWKFLIIFFMALAFIQSCDKDDINPEPNAVTDTGTPPDTNGDNNGNGNPDPNGDNQGNAGENGEITLYRVEGGNIVKQTDFKVSGTSLEFQKDTQKHQEIWELTKKIIPLNYLSKMSRFMIFAGEADGTAGYVYNTAQDLSKWEMGIAIDFAYQGGFNAGGELAYTIVHEFGHILTLDNTQLDASISENDCKNYFVGEGCAKEAAYINKTYNKGWVDIWSEFREVQQKDSQEASEAFYNKYTSRFVTNYASTNPAEDIAEVFATFVTRNGGVNGSSIAEEKIQIMYDHPELISLRNYIKGNTATAKSRSFLPAAGSWKKATTFGNSTKTSCLRYKK